MAVFESASLNETKEFWKAIFQKTNFTEQLMEVDTSKLTDFTFELPIYGNICIVAIPAVPLGTNFMSDVFIANASLDTGKRYTGFVKVGINKLPVQ